VSILAVDARAAVPGCDAGSRVDLHGTVELTGDATDPATAVRYRWLRGKEELGHGAVRLARGQRHELSHVTTRRAIDAEPVRFSLVIDAPSAAKRGFDFDPRCPAG
jgi:hypothetical protein